MSIRTLRRALAHKWKGNGKRDAVGKRIRRTCGEPRRVGAFARYWTGPERECLIDAARYVGKLSPFEAELARRADARRARYPSPRTPGFDPLSIRKRKGPIGG